MAFIATMSEEHASPETREMYAKNIQSMGYIPNYARLFSHRPQVMEAWGTLLGSIRSNLDTRRYELVTLAAAQALKSTYCALAHGSILCKRFFTPAELSAIAQDYQHADLTQAEIAMMRFAGQIVHDATTITQADIEELRGHGFSDAEIFDITTTAAARCFFSKTLDALGAEPDAIFQELDENLRAALTVGRAF